MNTAIKVCNIDDIELESLDLSWSMLWYDDLEEAGVDDCYFAFDGEKLVAFQSINMDGRCVAIEIVDSHQGKGIALMLVKASGSWKPERNECPEFWKKMEEIYG